MPATPHPGHEIERLGALQRYHLLDTPPEEAFDRITRLAARLFEMPIAAISLVDAHRQWFKSCYGLDMTEYERRFGFCAHAILETEALVVPDTTQDHRFADSLLVTGKPPICFYAGVPLRTPEGFALGTLCLMDRVPRSFSPEQRATLKDLAACVVSEMELRLAKHRFESESNERKLAEVQAEYVAYHDPLTGLPNRLLFRERLEQELAHPQRGDTPLALLFLDLDRFKVVNDTLGHELGDQLLMQVAERLQHCVRRGDTVSRMGGDEFAILLPVVESRESVEVVARRMIEVLRPPVNLDNNEFFITTSIGASVYPLGGTSAETLVKHADIALYHAKNAGRNAYHLYTPTASQSARELLTLESDLHRAFDNNEFVVYYQPKVSLKTGKIIGMEALVRWRHPERGMVSPADFIPLAEETGLIVPLGLWVLRSACLQTREWHRQGFRKLQVAVNLSLRQFQQPDLVLQIAEILGETGLHPKWLDLEITESVAMDSIDAKIKTLLDLKALGLHISLDDFGTGYSSLTYLKRLPIDVVKIDQSFVRMAATDGRDAAISSAIILLAHSLKLRVVAEGVEKPEQRDFLRRKGCDAMQGYLFSKPIPAEQFTDMLHGETQTPLARAA